MKSKCLDQITVIALLLNGAYVLRVQPEVFGSISYYVQMPSDSGDLRIGHISEQCAQHLWNGGFLVSFGKVVRNSGKVLTTFKLDKPDVSNLIRKSSAAADDNKSQLNEKE